jgi:enoyl-[acyl-carrier protein] reductase II
MTSKIHDDGVMDMTALANIKSLYFEGDMEAAPALSGQSVGLIDSVKSVDTIIKETINEFNKTCAKLAKEKFDE